MPEAQVINLAIWIEGCFLSQFLLACSFASLKYAVFLGIFSLKRFFHFAFCILPILFFWSSNDWQIRQINNNNNQKKNKKEEQILKGVWSKESRQKQLPQKAATERATFEGLWFGWLSSWCLGCGWWTFSHCPWLRLFQFHFCGRPLWPPPALAVGNFIKLNALH